LNTTTTPRTTDRVRPRRPHLVAFVSVPVCVMRHLPPGPLAVLTWLMHYGRNEEAAAWPSQERLAADMQIGVRSLRRYLDHLVDNGYLSVERRGNGATNLMVWDIPDAVLRSSDRPDWPIQTGQIGPSRPAKLADPIEGEEEKEKKEKDPPTPQRGDWFSDEDVIAVFDAWCEATLTGKRRQAKLDATIPGKTRRGRKVTRRTLIEDRLRGGWTRDELVAAVRGWRHSPHHRGENETGVVYDDLELILRDDTRIEHFRDLELGNVATGTGVGTPAFVAKLRQQADTVDVPADETLGVGGALRATAHIATMWPNAKWTAGVEEGYVLALSSRTRAEAHHLIKAFDGHRFPPTPAELAAGVTPDGSATPRKLPEGVRQEIVHAVQAWKNTQMRTFIDGVISDIHGDPKATPLTGEEALWIFDQTGGKVTV
jgi:hypothetical protein